MARMPKRERDRERREDAESAATEQAYLDLRDQAIASTNYRSPRPWAWKVGDLCHISGEGDGIFRVSGVSGTIIELDAASPNLPGAGGERATSDKIFPLTDMAWSAIDRLRSDRLGDMDQGSVLLPTSEEASEALPAIVDAVHEIWLRWDHESPLAFSYHERVEQAVSHRVSDAMREVLGGSVRALPVNDALLDTFGSPNMKRCGIVVAVAEGVLEITVPLASLIDTRPWRGAGVDPRPVPEFTLKPEDLKQELVSDNPADVWSLSAYPLVKDAALSATLEQAGLDIDSSAKP